ncbi:MAG: hypothetical protein F6J93_32535 [Oscillatoria sp. SIO1A7]|nr:hypothetical protein [Oscillatoria sp. SIO1A7]
MSTTAAAKTLRTFLLARAGIEDCYETFSLEMLEMENGEWGIGQSERQGKVKSER